MKKEVYRAGNVPEADIVAGLLQSRGIDASVMGRDLQTVVGAAAAPGFARIWVDAADYEAAREIVLEYEQANPSTSGSPEEEARKNAFPFLGLFTKPTLFWITVFLLLFWFLYGIPDPFVWDVDVIIFPIEE